MAKQYYSILTEHGTLAFAKAVGNKTPLQITHMAVGDGNGSNTTPNAKQTALVHEVYRAEISSISVDPRNNKQAVFELVIPENVGGFHIREMGIFDNQNKLVAVANCPESFKPTLGSGSGKVQVLRMILIVSASDAVTITMNNAIYATQIQLKPKTITANSINRVDDEGHSHAIDEATTSQRGIVQLTNDTGLDSDKLALTAKAGKKLAQYIAEIQLALAGFIKNDKKSSSVTSISEDTVATSKAVKTAYDLAANAIPNSKKSNAVNSPSADTVATSEAVKTAYDKAVAAEALASTKYTAQIATTTQRGLTHHYSGYDSDREDLSASAKVIMILKGFIDNNTRRFDNFIPNSKKSNAVNSPSGDTVATSAAVKTANDNANGRVNRAGDTMDGALLGKSGGMSTNNPNNIGFVFSGDNDSGMSNPQDGILQLNVNGQTVFEASALSKNTRLRNIADYTMDLQNDGNLVVKKGDSVLWHAFSTLLKSEFYDFRNKFTMATYNGTNSSSFVFRIPITQNLGVKMYVSQIRIDANLAGHRFNLAEAFTGYRVAMVTSADGNRRPLGAHLTSDTQVTINCDSIPTIQTVNLLVIGNYQY